MSKSSVADELAAIYAVNKGLDPEVAVEWAKSNPDSALHARLDWDDSHAAHLYRLTQMRNIITEVEVVYPDGKARQVYVSPVERRTDGGYMTLVDVLSNAERKERFLAQALAEYQRLGEKYESIKELAVVHQAVKRVAARRRGTAQQKAA